MSALEPDLERLTKDVANSKIKSVFDVLSDTIFHQFFYLEPLLDVKKSPQLAQILTNKRKYVKIVSLVTDYQLGYVLNKSQMVDAVNF